MNNDTRNLADYTQPATLTGWSLGGLYARKIGKLMAPSMHPDASPCSTS